MSRELAGLIGQKFIQRRDAKAVQTSRGYMPDRNLDDTDRPWLMDDLLAHLAGTHTYGHYLLDRDNLAKLMVFDIDLNKVGGYFPYDPIQGVMTEEWVASNPRDDWRDQAHPSRPYHKLELRTIAEEISSTIYSELGIAVATAYSGNKGLHVYGFTGTLPAAEIREGASLVLDAIGGFTTNQQGNYVPSVTQGVSFTNLTVEIYPKQDTLGNDGYGNLVRLPLGKNKKSPDPCFFIDQRASHDRLMPHADPIYLLKSGNPWAD